MLGAVIVAAGSSRRMGFDKLAAELLGLPVVERTLLAFDATPEVNRIVVVTRAENIAWIASLGICRSARKPISVIAGGQERQDSVLLGLEQLAELDPELPWAAVHDGARPLIAPESISHCFAEALKTGSGCLAAPVTDTLKRADADLTVLETVNREGLWAMQTPQIFQISQLIAAYRSVRAQGKIVTDEAAAMELAGHRVHLVANPRINSKITYQQDLKLAELILRSES